MDYTLNATDYGQFLLPGNDLISDAIKRGAGWDVDLLPIIRLASDPMRAAIDAGANAGFFSVQMSRLFAKVLAFEPQRIIYYNLCANLLLNNCRNVDAFNLALYKGPSRMSVAHPELQDVGVPIVDGKIDYDNFNNFGAVAFSSRAGAEEVEAVSIDKFYDLDISFIKCDCQGSDFDVLLGASQIIARCRPTIVFESEIHLEVARGIKRSDYISFFSQFGYTLSIVRGHIEAKQADFLAIPRELVERFAQYRGNVVL